MSLKAELETKVQDTFSLGWDLQSTGLVPAPGDLRLDANHAKDIENATVLCANLSGWTSMVDAYPWEVSAEILKSFLHCAAAISQSEGGVITGCGGDRIMAIFTGDNANTHAVRCGLKISYAVEQIMQPALKSLYLDHPFALKHIVGIDTSRLRTARVRVHGDHDLVWIGRAANYAAKMASLTGMTTWITKSVYDALASELKINDGASMWAAHTWTGMDCLPIYGSTFSWQVD